MIVTVYTGDELVYRVLAEHDISADYSGLALEKSYKQVADTFYPTGLETVGIPWSNILRVERRKTDG